MKQRSKRLRLERQRGVAMVLMVALGANLILLSVLSLNSTLSRSVAQRQQWSAAVARQIAESAAAQAIARLKEGGITTPMSGGGATSAWVNYSTGQMYYSTTYDWSTELSTVRAWGRVAVESNTSTSTTSPDSVNFDPTGWHIEGIEVVIQGVVFTPTTPVYFGNGGIEKPLGGFNWTGGSDPADPSTWSTVTSSPASYQSNTIPFESSALDHPVDFIDNGGTPTPASADPHPYQIWASQNPIGQFNIEAWFANSAGTGYDPTTKLTPPPTDAYYDTSDKNSPDYPYPVNSSIPDVQDFSWALWSKYKSSTASNVKKLGSGSHTGTYGTIASPTVTFVTGTLKVAAGKTFTGAGILVVRDNYDPNVGGSNTPSTSANVDIQGTFKWTGLVIVAGWAPTFNVSSTGNCTIVGGLMGEDSVMSGGEISLDSATIIMTIQGATKILFSAAPFSPGGIVRSAMPTVNRRVISIREI
jgi:hypothetical protein